jgi:hypothetical protein
MLKFVRPDAGECQILSEMWQEQDSVILQNSSNIYLIGLQNETDWIFMLCRNPLFK